MSKAFTKESDTDLNERPLRLRASLPPGTVNYITPRGLADLQQELRSLQSRKRSESPLPDATEARLKELQEILAEVVVPKPSANADPDRARFGSTVVVRSTISGTQTYQIVGVEETDLDAGRISWLSPLAKTLIGKRAGEKVEFRSPAGKDVLDLVAVTQSDAEIAP
jgi:transcription elongation factor GreB